MRRAVAFISSTVKDLADVREHLRAELDAAGFDVRMSEDDSFPVSPGETSHDACLAVVRTADLFVLLVGKRYGGEYPGHNKSITWREWDEAMAAGLHPIVLIDKEVNEAAIACGSRRTKLRRDEATLKLSELDQRLAAEFGGKLPEWGRDLPGIQRFVDVLRKGHVDNWMHANWDGTGDHAWEIVRDRVSASLASYRRGWCMQRAVQDEQAARMASVARVMALVAQGIQIADGKAGPRLRVLDRVLTACFDDRAALFGCVPGHSFSLTVHQRVGEGEAVAYRPYKSRRTSDLRDATRCWRPGEGHVGRTALAKERTIAPDLEQSDGAVPPVAAEVLEADPKSTRYEPSDTLFHRSAVSVPLGDPVGWVVTVTTSRCNHFAHASQPAVQAVEALAFALWVLLDPPRAEGPAVDVEA